MSSSTAVWSSNTLLADTLFDALHSSSQWCITSNSPRGSLWKENCFLLACATHETHLDSETYGRLSRLIRPRNALLTFSSCHLKFLEFGQHWLTASKTYLWVICILLLLIRKALDFMFTNFSFYINRFYFLIEAYEIPDSWIPFLYWCNLTAVYIAVLYTFDQSKYKSCDLVGFGFAVAGNQGLANRNRGAHELKERLYGDDHWLSDIRPLVLLFNVYKHMAHEGTEHTFCLIWFSCHLQSHSPALNPFRLTLIYRGRTLIQPITLIATVSSIGDNTVIDLKAHSKKRSHDCLMNTFICLLWSGFTFGSQVFQES